MPGVRLDDPRKVAVRVAPTGRRERHRVLRKRLCSTVVGQEAAVPADSLRTGACPSDEPWVVASATRVVFETGTLCPPSSGPLRAGRSAAEPGATTAPVGPGAGRRAATDR